MSRSQFDIPKRLQKCHVFQVVEKQGPDKGNGILFQNLKPDSHQYVYAPSRDLCRSSVDQWKVWVVFLKPEGLVESKETDDRRFRNALRNHTRLVTCANQVDFRKDGRTF